MRSASAASNVSPVRIQRIALPQPAARGNRMVAPPNGRMPRATSICANVVDSAATAISLARMSSIPSVRQMPCTAMTTGFVSCSPLTCQGLMPPSGDDVEPSCRDPRSDIRKVEAAGEVVAVREDQPAAQLGVRARVRRRRARAPEAVARSAALRLSARLRPMRRMWPSRSTVTRGSDMLLVLGAALLGAFTAPRLSFGADGWSAAMSLFSRP